MRRKFIAACCAYLLFTKTFPAARSRALFVRHTGRMTTYITRETMLIGPPRGVVKRESARSHHFGLPSRRSVSTLSRLLTADSTGMGTGTEDKSVHAPATRSAH